MSDVSMVGGAPVISSIGGIEGSVSADVVFLLMCESQSDLTQQLQEQIATFKADIALQRKYGLFREIMTQLQSIEANGTGATSAKTDNGIIKAEQLRAIQGLTSDQIEELMSRAGPGIHDKDHNYLDAGDVAQYLNEQLFGGNEALYVKVAPDTKIPHGGDAASQADQISSLIDQAMNSNTTDPALRAAQMSEIQHKNQQMMSLFSSFLKNDHETKMSIISKM